VRFSLVCIVDVLPLSLKSVLCKGLRLTHLLASSEAFSAGPEQQSYACVFVLCVLLDDERAAERYQDL